MKELPKHTTCCACNKKKPRHLKPASAWMLIAIRVEPIGLVTRLTCSKACRDIAGLRHD